MPYIVEVCGHNAIVCVCVCARVRACCVCVCVCRVCVCVCVVLHSIIVTNATNGLIDDRNEQ